MNPSSQSQLGTEIFKNYKLEVQLPFKIRKAPLKTNSFCERDGHWSQKEKLKYADILESNKSKKRIRVYEMMADMIITRSPNQCRSHHQKMEKFRKSIKNIIQAISCRYEPRVYHEITEKYLILIKDLLQNAEKYDRSLSILNSEDKIRKIKKKGQHSELKRSNQINIKLEESGNKEMSCESYTFKDLNAKPNQKQIQLRPTAASWEDGEEDDEGDQNLRDAQLEDEPRLIMDMKEENFHENFQQMGEFYPSERIIGFPVQSDMLLSNCYQQNLAAQTINFDSFGSSRNVRSSKEEINLSNQVQKAEQNCVRGNLCYQEEIRNQIAAKTLQKQTHQLNCQRLSMEYFVQMKSMECCDQMITFLNSLLLNKSSKSIQTQETLKRDRI